jgi:hypothetical protein
MRTESSATRRGTCLRDSPKTGPKSDTVGRFNRQSRHGLRVSQREARLTRRRADATRARAACSRRTEENKRTPGKECAGWAAHVSREAAVPSARAVRPRGRGRRLRSRRRRPAASPGGKRVALDLPDTLAADLQLAADLLQRGRLAVEAEAQLQHPALTLRQATHGVAHRTCTQRLGRLGLGIERVRIGEQVAELALAVGADRLVQRDRASTAPSASST